MSKYTLKSALYHSLAMRGETQEQIRRAALSGGGAVRRVRLSRILVAACLMAVLSLGAGAAALKALYYVPGHGIYRNTDFKVYSTKEQFTLGEVVVEAVTRTVSGGESTVCLWTYRPESFFQGMDIDGDGNGLSEANDFRLIYAENDETANKRATYGSYSTRGFAQAIFVDMPHSNEFTIRDYKGNEIAVNLTDVSTTEYADIKSISFGNASFVALPLSGSGNLFAGELTDELTRRLSVAYNRDIFALASCSARTDNGGSAFVSGEVSIAGGMSDNYGTLKIGVDDFGKVVEEISLLQLSVLFAYPYEDVPMYGFEVPADGEKIKCDFTLLESDGVVCKLKSIENVGGELRFETKLTGYSQNKYRSEIMVGIGVYGAGDGEGAPSVDDRRLVESDSTVTGMQDGKFCIKPIGMQPGQRFYAAIGTIAYTYDKLDEGENPYKNLDKTLGTIKLK